MHPSALELAKRFFELYSPPPEAGAFDLLEIGSCDVNGSLREVAPERCRYIGVDLEDGPGVDRVIETSHALPFPDGSFDVIVSSSCLEHDWAFWATVDEAMRVLRPGGVFYVNAPSDGLYHSFPIDCWRFYPDAGIALVRWVNRHQAPKGLGPIAELIESFTWVWDEPSAIWNDSVMIFGRTPIAPRAPAAFIGAGQARAINWRRMGLDGVGRYQELPPALDAVARVLAYLGAPGDGVTGPPEPELSEPLATALES